MAIDNVTRLHRPTPKTPVISFYESNFQGTDQNLHNPVVISVIVGNFIVEKNLIDQGSSADILFYSTFEKMQLTEVSLTPCKGDLIGFSGERVDIRGAIWLRTMFNSQPKAKTIDV
ncbi:hypothetical protein Cni_G07168 [Canna indica]|uniref:Uncharacterized protein n=1 Tax=Canna indica TaxID=4628 RepID=A0AAQ3K1N9_9LILI|nr:hypothetical protein Cni_G07168 [Canna indica]